MVRTKTRKEKPSTFGIFLCLILLEIANMAWAPWTRVIKHLACEIYKPSLKSFYLKTSWLYLLTTKHNKIANLLELGSDVICQRLVLLDLNNESNKLPPTFFFFFFLGSFKMSTWVLGSLLSYLCPWIDIIDNPRIFLLQHKDNVRYWVCAKVCLIVTSFFIDCCGYQNLD